MTSTVEVPESAIRAAQTALRHPLTTRDETEVMLQAAAPFIVIGHLVSMMAKLPDIDESAPVLLFLSREAFGLVADLRTGPNQCPQ